MFEGLAEKLQEAFKNLRGDRKLTEADVEAALREVRIALLEADVNFRVVKEFVARVKEQAIGGTVLDGLNPAHLAAYLRKQGKQVVLAGCDVHRPATIKQLQIVVNPVLFCAVFVCQANNPRRLSVATQFKMGVA